MSWDYRHVPPYMTFAVSFLTKTCSANFAWHVTFKPLLQVSTSVSISVASKCLWPRAVCTSPGVSESEWWIVWHWPESLISQRSSGVIPLPRWVIMKAVTLSSKMEIHYHVLTRTQMQREMQSSKCSCSHLPVQVISGIFKVSKEGDRTEKFGQLLSGQGGESAVLKCTRGDRKYKWGCLWQHCMPQSPHSWVPRSWQHLPASITNVSMNCLCRKLWVIHQVTVLTFLCRQKATVETLLNILKTWGYTAISNSS